MPNLLNSSAVLGPIAANLNVGGSASLLTKGMPFWTALLLMKMAQS